MKTNFKNKKLIVFDMDGTLTPSKAPMRKDMSRLLSRLLEKKRVAVIGGGSYMQFRQQFIAKARLPGKLLNRLLLFPVSGTACYRYSGGWKKVYAKDFTLSQKKEIFSAFRETFRIADYKHPRRVYGQIIEDRGSQITFSAVGQDVVTILGVRRGLAVKERWNKYFDVRPRLMKELKKLLPQFTIRRGGLTSIDITKYGVDKAYGIRQIGKQLRVTRKDMFFVGDAIFPGGNDYAVVKTGVDYVKVRGPKETEKIIKMIIAGGA